MMIYNLPEKRHKNEKKDFLLFKNVKDELKKHSIDIHTLEPLINVIKIFDYMHFRPLTILSEFSDINAYRSWLENKDREIKQRESHIQDLKAISDNYEMKITSKEVIIQCLKQLENLGFNASDIKYLYLIFLKISKKYGLNKKEIKIRFFRCMNYYFNDLLPLLKDILEKTNKISILNNEISSQRKIIEESQPIVFSLLQNLLNEGLNEHDILMAFKKSSRLICVIICLMATELILNVCQKILNRYPTVRDTLEGLNNKILIKKSYIDKLVVLGLNLESFLLSLVITTIYFYSTIFLNAKQVQIQKNLKILLILNFNYLPLLCIVIKEHKKYGRSKFIHNRTKEQQEQEKIERERKNCKKKTIDKQDK